MNLKEYKKKALQNPSFKKEYERFDLCFELQEVWIRIRIWFLSLFK